MSGNVTGSHDVLLLVPLVVFAAYLVFGITGFGASPITIPVLVPPPAGLRAPAGRTPRSRLGAGAGLPHAPAGRLPRAPDARALHAPRAHPGRHAASPPAA